MEFKRRQPAPELALYVKNLWCVEVTEKDLPLSQLYFPFGAFELACHIGESPKRLHYVGGKNASDQPTLFFAGQFTRSFFLTFDKPCICVGISFYPWAGDLLFRRPGGSFSNAMVPLKEIEYDEILSEKLEECKSVEEYFNALEKFVANKVAERRPDEVSAYVAKEIIKSPVRTDISKAIDSIGLSRRRIEQRFSVSTGLSIGMFTRKMRFHKAVSMLKKDIVTEESLTQVGLKAGYFDQSHFISEFKYFAYVTPGAFLQQNHELKDFLRSLTITEETR